MMGYKDFEKDLERHHKLKLKQWATYDKEYEKLYGPIKFLDKDFDDKVITHKSSKRSRLPLWTSSASKMARFSSKKY